MISNRFLHKGAVYVEARAINDLTPEYLKIMKSNDWVRVFHATTILQNIRKTGPQNMVFGIDTDRTSSSNYTSNPLGNRYRGLFVAPTFDTVLASSGNLIFEFAVKARNLHPTNWEGDYKLKDWVNLAGETYVQKMLQSCETEYPDSFNPLLSGALSTDPKSLCGHSIRKGEPQALFVGIAPAKDILFLYDNKVKYTPLEFIERNKDYLDPAGLRSLVSPLDPKRVLSWDEYSELALSIYPHLNSMESLAKAYFRSYLRGGDSEVYKDIKIMAPFSNASAKKFWNMIKSRYCDIFLQMWESDSRTNKAERPICQQQ